MRLHVLLTTCFLFSDFVKTLILIVFFGCSADKSETRSNSEEPQNEHVESENGHIEPGNEHVDEN